jgi:hypothetical protein
MKDKCLIGFSFDDGRIDNYTIVRPILKEFKLPATFNVTTGYIRGDKTNRPTDVAPMNENMIKELYNDGLFEIAGHGYHHENSIDDILKGISELKKIQGTTSLTKYGNGFASPGTGLARPVWNELRSHNIVYARLSLTYKRHAMFKAYCRKASRILHLPLLYRLAYEDTLMSETQDGILYSIPVLSSIKLRELRAIIKYAVKKRQCLVLMFHSIVPDMGGVHDNWDFEVSKFRELCNYLCTLQEKGVLAVKTSMDIYNYLKDKNNV